MPFLCFNCDQKIEYEGDGQIDRGFIIYPTFRVIFPEILIEANTNKTYTFRGAPSDKLILRLAIKKDINRQELTKDEFRQIWHEIETKNVIIKLSISANEESTSLIGPAPIIKSWTLAAYGEKYYFWNKKLSDLILNNKKEYKLNIQVFAKEGLSLNTHIVPILEGGGFGQGDLFRP